MVAENTVLTFYHLVRGTWVTKLTSSFVETKRSSQRHHSPLTRAYSHLADLDEVADNDDYNLSTWTNWCGPRGDVQTDYLTPEQLEKMEQAFKTCQDESESLAEKVAKRKAEEGGESPKQPIPPSYVFQILSSKDGSILFTWPPPMPTGDDKDIDIHGPSIDNEQRYVPAEYAMLAKGVLARPRDKQSEEARTNCTKRYQSKHPM